jgi:hypothetical protein
MRFHQASSVKTSKINQKINHSNSWQHLTFFADEYAEPEASNLSEYTVASLQVIKLRKLRLTQV